MSVSTDRIAHAAPESRVATAGPHDAAAGEEASCPNCGERLVGKYCHGCGERRIEHHEFSVKHFVHDAGHELTHLDDSKVIRTLKALLLRPGLLTNEYVAGRKSRYLKPLRLCLTIFALSLFVYSFHRPVSVYDIERAAEGDKTGKVSAIIDEWAGMKNLPRAELVEKINLKWHKAVSVAQLSVVLFFAVFLTVVYWGTRRYFVEHLIFSLHFISFGMLTGVFFWPLYLVAGMESAVFNMTMAVLKLLMDFVYLFFALRAVYGEGRVVVLLKSLVLLAGYFGAFMLTYIGAFIYALNSVLKA